MTPFKLEIITPDKVFFDGECEEVIVRTTVGDKGILARHEPYIAALTIGKMLVRIDGQFRRAAISEGVIKVSKEKTVILVQSCEWGDEIDLERAENARRLAEQRLESADEREMLVAEYKLKRAINRIETYNSK